MIHIDLGTESGTRFKFQPRILNLERIKKKTKTIFLKLSYAVSSLKILSNAEKLTHNFDLDLYFSNFYSKKKFLK